MYYIIKEQLKLVDSLLDISLEVPSIEVITYDEWENRKKTTPISLEDFKGYKSIHFCKLESFTDYMLGTFCIPSKQDYRHKKCFFYYLYRDRVIFIDNSGVVNALLEKISHLKTWESPSIETFFSSFLELLIDTDLLYLEELENKINKMEAIILGGDISHFSHKLMAFRKELLTRHYYYSQLIEVGETLLANESLLFDTLHLPRFSFFTRKVARLQGNVQMLREYALQVREEYQAQIDIKQNNTMRILTVVTAIFLPLTLIAGWYGMNFAHMPELNWAYGYPSVIIVSLLISIVTIWICKKKKFL